MFADIGKKIMTLAKVCAVLDIIAAVILVLAGLVMGNVMVLLWALVLAALALNTWPLYGFGQLVEDVRKLRQTSCPEEQEKSPVAELPKL